MRKLLRIGILCILILKCFVGLAQQNILRFKPIYSPEYLTNSVITFLKDSRGLMWFGTSNNGLLRYDGKLIVSFYNKDQINAKNISTIVEDKDKTLWLSTENGLIHYDPINHHIENFIFKANELNSLASNNNPFIFMDALGNLWVTNNNKLQRFNRSKKEFTTQSIRSNLSSREFENEFRLNKAFVDSKGRIWLYSINGVFLYDAVNNFAQFFRCKEASTIQSMEQIGEDDFFISFWERGLYRFNAKTGRFKYFAYKDEIVRNLLVVDKPNGKRYLMVIHDQVSLISIDSLGAFNSQKDFIITSDLQENYFHCVYKDATGNIWLASNLCVQVANYKNLFTYHSFNIESVEFNDFEKISPWRLYKDQNSYLISFWFSRGYAVYDHDWKLIKYSSVLPGGAQGIYKHCVFDVFKSQNKHLWYISEDKIVEQYKGKSSIVTLTGKKGKIRIPVFRNIIERRDGLFWIRTVDQGIYLFDPQNSKFLRQYQISGTKKYLYMGLDSLNRLWVGCDVGLYCYNELADSLERQGISAENYSMEDNNLKNIVYYVNFDEWNNKWISTEGGLMFQKNGSKNFSEILKPNGESFNLNYKSLWDKSGNLWINQQNALIRYNPKKNNISIFDAKYGLPKYYKGFSGVFDWLDARSIVIGSIGNLITFQPEEFDSYEDAQLLITEILVDGKVIPFSNVNGKLKIEVPAASREIYIHFAFPYYNTEKYYKLFYKVDSDSLGAWKLSKAGDLYFYGLSEGTYDVQFKVENESPSVVPVIQLEMLILPRWYKTIWFNIILAFSGAAMIYGFVKWRLNQVRQIQSHKQHVIEAEIAALKAQMNPHFMFNCINSIDAFIYTNDKMNATKYLNMFAKLMRNILESSRSNVVTLSKDIETLNLYIQLEQLRSNFSFAYQFDIDPNIDLNEVKVPPLIMQPFVENSIIHGFRNFKINNAVIKIKIRRNEDVLDIEIADNGIGFKNNSSNRSKEYGSYGIKLSQDRVKLFNETESNILIAKNTGNDEFPGTRVNFKLIIK